MSKSRDPQLIQLVARNIRAIRLARGLNQKQLQIRAGWKYQAMVSQLETGSVGAGQATLRKLANALEVEPATFLLEKLPEEFQVTEYESESVTEGHSSLTSARRGTRHPLAPIKVLIFDQDDIRRGKLADEKAIGEFMCPLPVGGGNKKDLVSVLVRKGSKYASPVPATAIIVILDRNDCQPPTELNFQDIYAIKTAKGVLFRHVMLEGRFLKLFEFEHDNEPNAIDLGLEPTPIIGKVISLELPYQRNTEVA